MKNILLLDCSESLKNQLIHEDYDVLSGTVGFCNGIRELPCKIYERDIIIYDPRKLKRKTMQGNATSNIEKKDIIIKNYEFSLADIEDHIKRGALLVSYINQVENYASAIRSAYDWIPFLPKFADTKDNKIDNTEVSTNPRLSIFRPITEISKFKIPVTIKLLPQNIYPRPNPEITLLRNFNDEALAYFLGVGNGMIILLPECKSNDDMTLTIIHRMLPQLFPSGSSSSILDQYISPSEQDKQKQIQEIAKQINLLQGNLKELEQELRDAERKKIAILEKDETAKLILTYYQEALRQKDIALYLIFKIREALQNYYGTETKAKTTLNVNTEWSYIGKITNETYRDVRHAPQPGDKIHEPTEKEVEQCFEYAKKIMFKYFDTLFNHP